MKIMLYVQKKVKINDKDCHLTDVLCCVGQTCFVRMLFGTDSIGYLSCVPFLAKDIDQNEAGINAAFARTLKVSEGDEVVISPLDNVTSVSSIYITPVSNDDFEILVSFNCLFLKNISLQKTGKSLNDCAYYTSCLIYIQ